MNTDRRSVNVLDREYRGTTSTLRSARNDVVDWLKEHYVDQDLQDRAALVLSELTSNAVQACPGNPYGVRASVEEDGAVVMAVTSRGGGGGLPPPREQWGPASVLAPRGRGLLIVGELSDDVVVDHRGDDTIVVTSTLRAATQA